MTRLATLLALVVVLSAPAFAQSAPEPVAGNAAEAALSEEALERHVGGYTLQPGMILSITRDAGRLYAGISDQAPYEMVGSSETEFWVTAIGAQITFNRAADGATKSLTLHQNGVTMTAGRVE